jgi:hypothetical protein
MLARARTKVMSTSRGFIPALTNCLAWYSTSARLYGNDFPFISVNSPRS